MKALSFFLFGIFFSLEMYAVENPIPLNEIKKVISNATTDSEIIIKNGTYKDINITLENKRNINITIKAETPGKVIVTGGSTIVIRDSKNITLSEILFQETQNSSSIIIYGSNNIRITENYFLRCGKNPFHMIVKIENGSHSNKICHNTFEDNRSMGIVVMTSEKNPLDQNNTKNEIFNNRIFNIADVNKVYPNSSGNGLEAIQIGQGGAKTQMWKLYTEIYNNSFENITGDGVELISIKSSNNKIYNNFFDNNKSGITIRGGNNVYFYNNFLKNTSRGLRIFGANHRIYNNYFEGGDVGIQLPAANVSYNNRASGQGHDQVYSARINGNIVVDPKDEAFSIGGNYDQDKRNLLPVKTVIRDNRIVLTNSVAKDFNSTTESALTNIKRSRNRSVRRNSDNKASAIERGANFLETNLIEDKKREFETTKRSLKIGANWK